jgi:hypothetical protein
MASWKVGPALAAGNSVVLKPAEQSPLTALRLGELASEAGIPDGVLQVVPGLGETAGRAIGLHMDVDMVAFTGSTQVGKFFLEYSGQSNMKRVALECGGKSPHIVMPDCSDLDSAATAAAWGIFFNQVEVCNAGSRLLLAGRPPRPSDSGNPAAARLRARPRRHREGLDGRPGRAAAAAGLRELRGRRRRRPLRARGAQGDGSPWTVGVEDPRDPARDLAVLTVRDRAVATSSVARRRWVRDGRARHHLIDPRTGEPAAGDVLAATVVAASVARAEVLAKVALVLGAAAGRRFLDARPDAGGILALADGGIATSDGLREAWHVA